SRSSSRRLPLPRAPARRTRRSARTTEVLRGSVRWPCRYPAVSGSLRHAFTLGARRFTHLLKDLLPYLATRPFSPRRPESPIRRGFVRRVQPALRLAPGRTP